jgi:cell division protein YceG involved in septum cleavage
MKPQFMIIAILIILKVIGVAGRANAANYLPGYTCDGSTIFQINCGESYYEINKISSGNLVCNRNNKSNFIAEYSNPYL